MINQIIPIKPLFPKLNPKPQSIRAVLLSISSKKQQLQKQLTNSQFQAPTFPTIIAQNQQLTPNNFVLTNEQHQSKIIKNKTKQLSSSLIPQYRAIHHRTLQQNYGQRQKMSQFIANAEVKGKSTADNHANKVSDRNKRINTQVQRKKRQPDLDQLKHFREIEEREEKNNAIEEAKLKFQSIVPTLPHLIKNKTEGNLEEAIEYLQTFNPFFNRNPRVLNICLLKMGRIINVKACKLYTMGQQLKYFYIIMLGKVKLSNGGLRKVCQTGQTILQQIMFQAQLKKISLEKAKTVGHTILLEMRLAEYARMKQQLIKHGYKTGFLEMESIIKRNYIVKNWLRNKIKLQNNK